MKTALVVDDDPIIRKLIHVALAKHYGWEVLEAEDGVDGVARFLLHRPDVLITDISMPNSDGLEMLAVLRKDGLLDDVHVVIMSSGSMLKAVDLDAIGSAVLLSKPFNLPDLRQAVEAPDTENKKHAHG